MTEFTIGAQVRITHGWYRDYTGFIVGLEPKKAVIHFINSLIDRKFRYEHLKVIS